jgi:hypothetical protein
MENEIDRRSEKRKLYGIKKQKLTPKTIRPETVKPGAKGVGEGEPRGVSALRAGNWGGSGERD